MKATLPFFMLALAGCSEDPALTKCDAAIKATLKAPSSYRRVSNDTPGSLTQITYDAVNEFNAPIRHRGWCSVSGGQVKWTEAP